MGNTVGKTTCKLTFSKEGIVQVHCVKNEFVSIKRSFCGTGAKTI